MKSEYIIDLAIKGFNGATSQIVEFSKGIIGNEAVTNNERVMVFRKNFELMNSKLKTSSEEAEYIFKFLEDSKKDDEIDVVLQDCYLPLTKSFLKVDAKPVKALHYLEQAYSANRDNKEYAQNEIIPLYPIVASSFVIRDFASYRLLETLELMKKHEIELGVKNTIAETLIEEFHDDSGLGIGYAQAVSREYDKRKSLAL